MNPGGMRPLVGTGAGNSGPAHDRQASGAAARMPVQDDAGAPRRVGLPASSTMNGYVQLLVAAQVTRPASLTANAATWSLRIMAVKAAKKPPFENPIV